MYGFLVLLSFTENNLGNLFLIVSTDCKFIHWNLSNVADFPPQWALAATSECFVYEHPLSKSDSLASLSIRFNTTPSSLKRVNNLVSESLASRTHIFVPVSRPDEIIGKRAVFVRCPIARKNYVVLSACGAGRHEPASVPAASGHADKSAQKVRVCHLL
ncbi:hypothetical protein DUNSADRAFT_12910 [Dunaliella salina]|uniref:LysM domain-containing protein n=1 Tax=Dunaliella salina TaxID=3046 RepID=A0ABQ7H3M6_DUNSA|nr:hypothetical protein DUNSADRAFT_12910 [Dunaliella salina]|eukprot:KAF5841466.1 hypothetical protein DUNSADRAFT_12910 [Dunaliella salina]